MDTVPSEIGTRVSAIGLGCNPFGNEVDPPTAAAIVGRALDLGITYFDTADSYFEGRSEDYLYLARPAAGPGAGGGLHRARPGPR